MQEAMDLHRRGAIADAASRYAQIIQMEPANVDALCLLGLAYGQLQRPAEAVDLLRRATVVAPDNVRAHMLLGGALKAQGRPEEALASFDQAIAHQPGLLDAYTNRADALMALKRPGEAVETYDRALTIRPDFAEGWCSRGLALEMMARQEDAIASYDRAIELKPSLAEAYANRGNALAGLRQHEAAVESFDRAIAAKPDFPEVYVNRGNSLARLGRSEDALASYDRAIAWKPDMAEAHFSRSMTLRDQTRFAETVESLDRAIMLNQNAALRGLLYSHRAEALNLLGRFPEALADVKSCVEVAPNDDQALFAVSLVELLHGRWHEAWPKYERRIAIRVGIPEGFKLPPWPAWHGEGPEAGPLVLRGEQGLGDHLMFSNFAADLAKRGYRVVLWTRPSLVPLLGTVPGVERVVSDPAELGELEGARWTSLMSVPGILSTTPKTVPQNSPFLAAEPDRVAQWRDRLGAHGFKIGIGWQNAGTSHLDPLRSIPLRHFSAIAEIPGVRLISLQKGKGVDEITTAKFPVETLGSDFDNDGAFLDTAAVMENLDLVITPCGALAHLAGGLARPTYVALMHVPEWRWLLDRDDSPWYPAARLFRQSSAGDWHGVFARIAGAAREFAQSK
jgi:tetratricopeptide (TPR) repeat protein